MPRPANLLAAALGPRLGSFRRFWLAVLISSLGTWAATIGLALRLYDGTHSNGWLSALFVAEFLPPVLVSVLAAPLLDRLPTRATLVVADLVRALVFAVLAGVRTPGVVVALSVVAGVAGGVFAPVSLAAVPRLVPDGELDAANSALGTADSATTFVGTALGGLLVAAVGASALLGLNALSFLLSGLLLAGVPALRGTGAVHVAAGNGYALRLAQAVRAVRASPLLRTVAGSWTIVGLSIGIFNALLVPLLRGVLGTGSAAAGLVAAASGAGLIAGNVAAAQRVAAVTARFPLVLVTMGAGIGLTGLAPSAAVAALTVLAMGAANGMAIVHNRSGVQRASTPHQRAGIFAFLIGASSLATAAGAAAAGPLADVVGTRGAFVAAGTLIALLAAPAAAVLRRSEPAVGRAGAGGAGRDRVL